MAYSTILDEHRRRGASFDEAVERLMAWAASAADGDERTVEERQAERAEERIARENEQAMGQIDAWLRGG